MRISPNKVRTPLGKIIFALPEYEKNALKNKLMDMGMTEGRWRGMYERIAAHLLPTYIRDVIVEELPDTAELFNHPAVHSEAAS